MLQVDKRAKKILLETYDPRGRDDETPPAGVAADVAYAKSKGYMFDPITIDHDALVAQIVKLVGSLNAGDVSGAFLASLSTRRLDWRSGLVSYVLGKKLARHRLSPKPPDCDDPACESCARRALECQVCEGRREYRNVDANVFSYDRHGSGNGHYWQYHPLYALHDLTELARDLPISPQPEDLEIFEAVLAAIVAAPRGETPAKLSKRLTTVIASSKRERDTLLESLALMGVLVAKEERNGPSTDWMFVEDWRGEDGYKKAVIKTLFGMHRKRRRRAR